MLHIEEQRDDYVELVARGKLERDDYERVLPLLEAQLEREGALRALIVLRDFKGWTLGAALDDLRFDLSHRKDFDRMAIVGEGSLQKWATTLSAPLFSGEVRFYELAEEQRARDWVRAGADVEAARR